MSGVLLFEYMNKYSYIKINNTDIYYCIITIAQFDQSHKFIFLVLTMNIICSQIWTNRTHVHILYCTTIRERAFGRGYLKLEISFYFFKNAKADSPVHSLLNFSIPPSSQKAPNLQIPVHTYLSPKLPFPNHLSYPLS